jgi:DNA-binding transcriptional LysR family regulator
MDLLLLQCFLRLAAKLHFTQTSQELLVTQPALSRQIKQLEQQVQATLLKLSRRNVELTSAGKYFQQEVTQLLQHRERPCRRTGQIHRREAGEIRIGYTNTALQTILPGILMNLKRQLPALKTTLFEMSNEVQLEALARKEIDLGFSTSPNSFLSSYLTTTRRLAF